MFEAVLTGIYYFIFFAVPIILASILLEYWVSYLEELFIAKQDFILLEIKLPKEMFKSPKAAEFFINGLFSSAGGNWYEKYWNGSVQQWHSLEIVSVEGAVKFFIWTKKGNKNQIEANLYSQFPGIEIYDVPDHALSLKYDSETDDLFGTEFDLTKPDVFPIKTYIDYGMDKDPKEEFKIDPLTPLIEAMGALGRHNYAGLQIMLRGHGKEERDPVTKEAVDLRWQKDAKVQIDKLLGSIKGEKDKEGKIVPGTGRSATEGEKEIMTALERSVSKTGFDVGMRLIYTAPKDAYTPGNIGGLIGGVMHFNSNSLNGFKPARGLPSGKLKNPFLMWKDRNKEEIYSAKKNMLNLYKRRAYFNKPFKRPHFVLNTEELATIYHFPGGVSYTPTFTRIESKKSQAPVNLPI